MKSTITPNDLRQFTCTENYFQSKLPNLWYSDGARHFFINAGAYWFLDIVQFRIVQDKKCKLEPFMVVKLNVENEAATITVDDGNGKVLWKQTIDFTDCPIGEWKFYLEEATCGETFGKLLMVPSER